MAWPFTGLQISDPVPYHLKQLRELGPGSGTVGELVLVLTICRTQESQPCTQCGKQRRADLLTVIQVSWPEVVRTEELALPLSFTPYNNWRPCTLPERRRRAGPGSVSVGEPDLRA